jgi:hypothetical protein
MADTWSWQPLVTGTVTPLLVVVLAAILPRLWQGERRRLQLESETRVKRLEALEKAMSLVGKVKSELGIEVTTEELQDELGRILHEFAGPVVRSREALEDWANERLVGRLLKTPRFTIPTKEARFVRNVRAFSLIMISLFVLYAIMMMLAHTLLSGYKEIEMVPYCIFYGFLYLSSRVAILQESKSALKAVGAMLKDTAEVKTPVLVGAGVLPEAPVRRPPGVA